MAFIGKYVCLTLQSKAATRSTWERMFSCDISVLDYEPTLWLIGFEFRCFRKGNAIEDRHVTGRLTEEIL
jgi:hypothetical protein